MGLFRRLDRKFIKRGFTDQLYWLNLKFVITFTCICVALNVFAIFRGISEVSIITYGIPAAFGELAIHTAVITNKALKENVSKYKGDCEG